MSNALWNMMWSSVSYACVLVLICPLVTSDDGITVKTTDLILTVNQTTTDNPSFLLRNVLKKNLKSSYTKLTNHPPALQHPLKKFVAVAGKVFRYIIDDDTFIDLEDDTNLTFVMYDVNGIKLNKDFWIQFLPNEREIYGLPLEKHVGHWSYIVEALDSNDLHTNTTLEIIVQKIKVASNFTFKLDLKLNQSFTNAIDWQIRALEGLVNLFRETPMEKFTVVKAIQKEDTYEFHWTFDEISQEVVCDVEKIWNLRRMLCDYDGVPSAGLERVMSPSLKVVAVGWDESFCSPTSSSGSPRPLLATTPYAFPPSLHNQIDVLTASVGHLFVLQIPDDTFFDPEDGDTRNLALSLRYSDDSELPHGYWLQLDPVAQELYGLPGPGDVGSVIYELVAEDSSKQSVYDKLIVKVEKPTPIKPTAEFRITLDFPFLELIYNAKNKRRFIEKLAILFGHKDTSFIRIASISDTPSTTVVWYNTSLPTDVCPSVQILELQDFISGDETNERTATLKDIIDYVFDKDMKVLSVTIMPLGVCLPESAADSTSYVEASAVQRVNLGYYQYYDNAASIISIVTFVIPAMIFMAIIIVFVATIFVFHTTIQTSVPNYPRLRII